VRGDWPVTNSGRITITGGSTTTFYDPVNTTGSCPSRVEI